MFQIKIAAQASENTKKETMSKIIVGILNVYSGVLKIEKIKMKNPKK